MTAEARHVEHDFTPKKSKHGGPFYSLTENGIPLDWRLHELTVRFNHLGEAINALKAIHGVEPRVMDTLAVLRQMAQHEALSVKVQMGKEDKYQQ